MIGYSKVSQVGVKKKSQTTKNINYSKLLDQEYKKRGINYCEVRIAPDCLRAEIYSNGELLKLTYAHKHKRIWYRQHQELLHSYNHTVRACIPCHMIMEASPKLTHQLFLQLRGQFSSAKENTIGQKDT